MRRCHFVVLIAGATFFLFANVTAAVTTLSPVIVDPATGYEYQLLSQSDWSAALLEAVDLGGNLATVQDAEQQNFIFNTFGDYSGDQRNLWIGLFDPTQDKDGGTHAGNFVWASGAPVTYTNWDVGEPNDANGDEFYTAMYYPEYHNPGSWNDWSGSIDADPAGIQLDGIVQFNLPEPSCLMAGAGLLLLARRRNRRI